MARRRELSVLCMGAIGMLVIVAASAGTTNTIALHGTRVYVAGPQLTDDPPPHIRDTYILLHDYLVARDYWVERVESENPREVLRNREAYFVVLGGTAEHVTARIFVSGRASPRFLRRDGADAEQQLADAIVRYIAVTPR